MSEFETLAEFKEDLKQKIVDRNMAQSEAKFRQALLAQMCDQVDIELPEAMIDNQINGLVENYAARLEQQGISLDLYLQYMQMSVRSCARTRKEPAVNGDRAADGPGRRRGCRGDRGQRRGHGREIRRLPPTSVFPMSGSSSGLDLAGLEEGPGPRPRDGCGGRRCQASPDRCRSR